MHFFRHATSSILCAGSTPYEFCLADAATGGLFATTSSYFAYENLKSSKLLFQVSCFLFGY